LPGACSASVRIIRSSVGASASAASRSSIPDASLTALFDQLGHESGPACLMACANARAVVTGEDFLEHTQSLPVGIVLECPTPARSRPPAIPAAQENVNQPP